MRLLSFETMPKTWPLWVRLAASTVFPATLGISGTIVIIVQPDRWTHAMGGAAMYCALMALWGTFVDATTYRSAWHERNFDLRQSACLHDAIMSPPGKRHS